MTVIISLLVKVFATVNMNLKKIITKCGYINGKPALLRLIDQIRKLLMKKLLLFVVIKGECSRNTN